MMKKFILFLPLIFFLINCQSKDDDKISELSIEFIKEANRQLSYEILKEWEAYGARNKNKFIIDNTKIIMTLQKRASNMDDKDINLILSNYKETLDSLANTVNLNNSEYKDLIEIYEKNSGQDPYKKILLLTLYESDILKQHAQYISAPVTIFFNSYAFSKDTYSQGEKIIFTHTAFEPYLYNNLTYDSVKISVNSKLVNLDYDLDQYVRTAVLTFTPIEPGEYNITIYSSFDSKLEEGTVEEISASITVKGPTPNQTNQTNFSSRSINKKDVF
ncbi:hypothetical protein OO013_16625 [Mangrovivirga sp. M17]|uniref:DUF4397 domain-containing protein n=1 Tax=Mangrovivirga halotolerans TaxID=2993936 RepID=A0ABT3RWA9_9BACT|nr:hypothetical protein [Mangrovivirga halotolerans]MCX2745507.1 hypothetical protein [Mangrovivirga halotolerans]